MSIKQISAFVENKPGKVFELFKTIADAGINIRAMNIADTKEFGVLRLIVENTEKTKEVLGEDTIVITTEVIAVEMEDKSGALCGILQVLADAGINIEYAYAFTSPTARGAYTVLRVDKVQEAETALSQKGYVLLKQEDLAEL
ncbi:MAG: ACT domain-containing protein [Parasporobacterium sp.]|nr:ACT domain-containing protein [Parasporobacterium sp.]